MPNVPSLYKLAGQHLKNTMTIPFSFPEIIYKQVQIQNNVFVVGNKIYIVDWSRGGNEIEGNIMKIYRNDKGFFLNVKENNKIKKVNIINAKNKYISTVQKKS